MAETPMQVHPAAEIFPMLSWSELRTLADDIAANGQRDPIVRHHGAILDGRNRLRACQQAGVEPAFVDRDDIADPVAFVVSVNLHRRHLDESQRAMVAARIRSLGPKLAPGRSAERVGEQLSVSSGSVKNAAKVQKKGAPELVAEVDAGRVAVSTAADLAELPREQQREIVATADQKVILDAAKKIRAERGKENRTRKIEKLEKIARGNEPLLVGPTGFPVIYADPPWKYDDGTTDPSRTIDNQYPPMELEAIKALPVGELATDAAILFMWATNPLLPEAMQVIEAWGFKYKTNVAWDKGIAGGGYWVRGEHELLLIATRGDMPTPHEGDRPGSMIRARRSNVHSEKPVEAALLIERMFPTLPKLEMFCRSPRPGWHVHGNQAGGKLATG